ncbi:HNH endonuclease protein [Rhizobium phage RHph_X2_26]|nr:HNH endonuclease protein [Rhizobium phage RHph_X2_26]
MVSVTKVLHSCFVCGEAFYPKRTDRTTCCGRSCGLEWAAYKTLVKATGGAVAYRCVMVPRAAVVATVAEPVAFTRARTPALRAAKARDKAKRRIAEGVELESFDPYAVFARDKWQCQECGIHTPRRKRGTLDDDAPELDHVRPLALGGAHTFDNAQCLCRWCNGRKGARVAA